MAVAVMHTWSVNDSDGTAVQDSALSLAVGSHRPCTALGLECTPPCMVESYVRNDSMQ